jgi:hypothetical protein
MTLHLDYGYSYTLKDCDERRDRRDIRYTDGAYQLAEELRRLFDFTPKGSLIDDPTYGVDFGFLGTTQDPKVAIALAKLACYNALLHPSFRDRFTIKSLDVQWYPSTPNALYVVGNLELRNQRPLQFTLNMPWNP